MSWWSRQTLASQRHHCLLVAREYKTAQTLLARAQADLANAQQAAVALGVTVAPQNQGSYPYIRDNARIQLPQEAAEANARARMGTARRSLYDALEECPAVLAEVFAMLGCP